MKTLLGIFFGLLLFTVSLVVVYLCMRSVMAIGGYCAEGGAYQIAVRCPKGVGWLMPLSIFAMFGGTALYSIYAAQAPNGPQWYYFFWSALFGALGWNFLDFALHPGEMGDVVGWWVCAILFMLMAIVPLAGILFSPSASAIYLDKQNIESAGTMLLGRPSSGHETRRAAHSQNVLVLIHGLALVGGILLGIYVFNFLT